MGELYERLTDSHLTKPKMSTDGLQACMRLFRLNQMSAGAAGLTVTQIDAVFANHYGAPLGTDPTGNNAGRQEAQDLLLTLPTGTTTTDRLARLERSAAIEAVLVIADLRQPPYDTAQNLRDGLRAALVALGAPANSIPDRS